MLAAEKSDDVPMQVSGHCCYSGRKDCDGSRDWCSKSESQCTACGGTFHANNEAAPSNDAAVAQTAALPVQLAGLFGTGTPAKAKVPKESEDVPMQVSGHCCYTGRKDCDGSRDWCSKGESQCTACGGTFHANDEAAPSNDAAVAQTAALPVQLAGLFGRGTPAKVPKESESNDVPMQVSGHCCYAGCKDCDGSRDWCSNGESHCTACGGTFHANNEAAPSKDAAVAQMAALPVQLAGLF